MSSSSSRKNKISRFNQDDLDYYLNKKKYPRLKQNGIMPGCLVSNGLSLIGGSIFPNPATPFSPASLPGLQLWLKADAGAYHDAGTTLATNGQTVQQWNDQSGLSHNVSQATSGDRPTFVTGVQNGLPVIRFNNAHPDTLAATFPLSQPTTVVAVVSQRSQTVGWYLWDGATADSMGCLEDSGPIIDISAGAFLHGPATDTAFHEIAAVYNGASSSVAVDNGTASTGNAGSSSGGGITLSGKGGGGGNGNIDLCEMLIYSAAVSSANLTLLYKYMKSRWGTP